MKGELKFIYRTMLPILTPDQDDIKKYVVVSSDVWYKDIMKEEDQNNFKSGHQWTVLGLDMINRVSNNLGSMQNFINNLEF